MVTLPLALPMLMVVLLRSGAILLQVYVHLLLAIFRFPSVSHQLFERVIGGNLHIIIDLESSCASPAIAQ